MRSRDHEIPRRKAASPRRRVDRIAIPLPPLFSFDAVVRSHGWYDLLPFRYDRAGGALETTVALAAGAGEAPSVAVGSGEAPVAIAPGETPRAAIVRFESADGILAVSGRGIGKAALTRLAVRVFSLDVDLSRFAAALDADSALSRALLRGGGRMLRSASLFEDAVKMLFTTNCSWAATRGMVERTIALAGTDGAFPSAARLAACSARRLERDVRCGYRAPALAAFARRVASGRLDLSRWEDRGRPAAEIREEITAEKGFGPYAAEGLLRILGRHDFLALDSWTRQKYRELYPGPARRTDGSIARRYARFAENRGLAMWLDLTRDWHEDEKIVWP